MIAEYQEDTSKGEDTPCVPPFDCFSQKLLELNLKATVKTSFILVGNSPKTIVQPNPFRIFLGLYGISSNTAQIAPSGSGLGSGGGIPLNNTLPGKEWTYPQHWPMSTIGIDAIFIGGGTLTLLVIEGIYFGNTRKKC